MIKKELFTFIKSKRLTLRGIRERDFDSLLAYRDDEKVLQYQGWTDKTESEIRVLIEEQKSLQPGIPGEWFMFAIELKTNEMIGDCAVCINENDPRQTELGITLSRASQGQGYAKEAISCILNFISNNLGFYKQR